MAEYTLPDLDWDYGALEPHISGEINELHHSKHHAAYVTNANIYAPTMMVAEKAADLLAGNTPLPPASVAFYRHGTR